MNGKKGSSTDSSSYEINIPTIPKTKLPETMKKPRDVRFSCSSWMLAVWEFCKQDKNRVIFSLKVGLAVLLVSLLILFQAPYQIFGTNIIWSILTVAIMFEYTVGATFNRGFNRALGSVLAGILAIIVAQVALSSGTVAEPYIIGVSIFLIGTVTSFMKLWPSLAPYEYGFRVILFTYCLIIISGYRMGSPIVTAMDRLYSIAIGAIVAVVVNVLVFPIWAGEQLHKELVTSFYSVADSLEECVRKYIEDEGSDDPDFFKSVIDEFPEPAYKKCRSTLKSSAKLESLAPYNLRLTFQKEIQEATSQAAELVRCLGNEIQDMKKTLIGDSALFLGLLSLFVNELIDMQFFFSLFSGYVGVSLLSPVMHNLWIWRGTGNENFYFATAMDYACF